MGDRTLRGARLGGQSFEDERGIEFAARQQVGYRCPRGHVFEITMSVEAEVPANWECPRCGEVALSVDGIVPEEKAEKPVRTHWDMLLERRSISELEDILTERLELLRGGEIGPAHLHRPASRSTARGGKTPAKSVKPKAKAKKKASA
ncbi:MAG: RNA polymerase-binding protein RbpA [Nocardioidaceae bacterium]|nr:RNA polymerase-binding protein RbpA [Nocardioidaceae bacterium]